MRSFFHDITQLMKKYRTGTIVFVSFVALMGIYMVLPRLLMEKPTVNEIEPTAIMEKTQFNADNRITLTGENLEHVIGVFVNGVWEPDCYVISSTENQLELQLPARYYTEAQDLAIQIETRINSDMTALSPKAKITVLPASTIGKPEITNIIPSRLSYNGELMQEITIEGSNFDEESLVLIDGKSYETEHDGGKLHINIPFSAWCDADDVTLNIVQYYNSYPTPVQSAKYYFETDRVDLPEDVSISVNPQNELAMTDEWIRNSQAMVQYLQLLDDERYVAIFSVMDDASYSMTDEVQNTLFDFGLKGNLFNTMRYSYLAVLDGGKVVYEAMDTGLLKFKARVSGISLHVQSAGFHAGSASSIQIDGVEYSPNQRGMNIVVYDKTTQTVVDSVCFDLFEKIRVNK